MDFASSDRQQRIRLCGSGFVVKSSVEPQRPRTVMG